MTWPGLILVASRVMTRSMSRTASGPADAVLVERRNVDQRRLLADRVVLGARRVGVGAGRQVARPLAPVLLAVERRCSLMERRADAHGPMLAQTNGTIGTMNDELTPVWGAIEVRGARENNLRDLDLDIPKRQLTVFTGVSGIGQELARVRHHRRRVAAADQRDLQLVRAGLHADAGAARRRSLEGLTTAIIVDQERMGANARSTVGTVTDANALLRILFSRLGKPHIGGPQAFSFNVPSVSGGGAIKIDRGAGKTESRSFSVAGGMCPRCEGMGSVNDIDLTQLYDETKSLAAGRDHGSGLHGRRLVDADLQRVRLLRPRQADPRLHARRSCTTSSTRSRQGQDQRHQPDLRRAGPEDPEVDAVEGRRRAAAAHPCVRRAGRHLQHLPGVRRHAPQRGGAVVEDQGHQHRRRLRHADQRPGRLGPRPRRAVRRRRCWATCGDSLDAFVEIGLGYLSLDRPSGTLSGGEAQRTRMIRHVGSSLTDVTYVFDEPTIGLHAHDVERMNSLLDACATRATRCSSSSTTRR